MDKEVVYDKEIAPLVEQVIEICARHKIPVLMGFAIPTDENPDLRCTSALWDNPPPPGYAEALKRIQRPFWAPLRMTVRDVDGTVTEDAVIIP